MVANRVPGGGYQVGRVHRVHRVLQVRQVLRVRQVLKVRQLLRVLQVRQVRQVLLALREARGLLRSPRRLEAGLSSAS